MHNCRQLLCDTAHAENDGHSPDCLCDVCHPEHDWRAWAVYPQCEGCEHQMLDAFEESYGHPVRTHAELMRRWNIAQAVLESNLRKIRDAETLPKRQGDHG